MASNSHFSEPLIVSFFSGDTTEERAEAYRLLRRKSGEVLLIAGQERTTDRRAAAYADLRLPGESVSLCWVHPRDLSGALEILRAANADSIFLIPDASADESSRAQTITEVGEFRLPERLERAYETAEGAWKYLGETYRLGHVVSPAARWLIDNSYQIRTQVAEIRTQFPAPLRKELGSLGAEVYQLAGKLVEQTNYSVSPNVLRDFLLASQSDHSLTISQLWIFPLLLRVVIIEALSRLATRMVHAQLLREMAFLWADRLAASARKDPETFTAMLQRLQGHEALACEADFAAALTEQLQDRETILVPVQQWIETRWHCPSGDLVRAEHTREASESHLAANAFGTLRTLAQLDFKDIFETTNFTERLLREDPGGIYPRSDFSTRDRCRQVVERVARQSGRNEPEIAEAALALAKEERDQPTGHVAQFLLGTGLAELESRAGARIPWSLRFFRQVRSHPAPIYLGGILGLTVFVALLTLNLAWAAGVHQPKLLALLGLLSIFPLSELAIQITHALLISLLAPTPLPKLDFREGIPDDAAALVVVPMMLSSVATVKSEVEKLEVRYLANRQGNLFFSLFADYTDADESSVPSDAVLLAQAREGIAALNARYGEGRFQLFHRERAWSPSEKRWIGRERKRGKIEDLNAFLCGETPGNILVEGRLRVKIRYVITLDADTQLPPSSALHLVETIAHPLNRVQIDPESKVRGKGYSIIQPRVSIALPGATATRFTRIFADAHGTDPYCSLVSDAQQDLFGDAIFHGKAVYEVESFHKILSGRFPEETLLSHDLIEGAHVGVGLVTDIELLENLPLNYPSFARRQHRWIRGDWQIAAWSFRKVPGPRGTSQPNPLPLLSRWRIFDNLRRSLVPIASVLLLLFGWFFSVVPGVWSIVVGLAVAIPAIAPLLERWSHQLEGSVYGWQGAADDLVRTTVMVAFLPHQAWVAADAIVRALHRKTISKERLLEWETAEAAEASGRFYVDATMRQMTVISAVSFISLIALGFEGSLPPTSAFLLLWISSPWLMRWLGSEGGVFRPQRVGAEDSLYLRVISRRTWRYFDDLVNEQSHWLPPDNSQLALRVEVAQRTSPTNIGLWLASAVAAWDFGYLTVDELRRRCGSTLATLDLLEKYEGHVLNWYDTATLQPLMPRYVSTVDSGNLVTALWVLAQACRDISSAPLLQPSSLRGLNDTLAILREVGGKDPSLSVVLQGLRGTLRGSRREGVNPAGRVRLAAHYAGELREALTWRTSASDELPYWTSRLAAELDAWSALVERYLGWMETLRRPPDDFVKLVGPEAPFWRRQALQGVPSLQELAKGLDGPLKDLLDRAHSEDLPPAASAWLSQLDREYREAVGRAAEAITDLHAIESSAQRIADGTKMEFLYDHGRRLFAVGYTVGEPVVFRSHYDLLASECRLASLVAIAKGDVPMDHWFALGRPRIATPKQRAFLSWSGTMFEYLMPLIFTQPFENSLLERACEEAVEAQIAYGEAADLPWGVSESAYSALDAHQIYQYRAFGVPDLALNPGADPGPVVAPYATMLALMVDAHESVNNLRRLELFGLSGPMGFYESIDFTRQGKKDARRGVVTFAYMAHHQGMTLLALNNVLLDARMQHRFHADLRIRAVRSLLFERIPIARTKDRQPEPMHVTAPEAVATEAAERTWAEPTSLPQVHLNSNGSYSLMLTNSGGGYSRWKGFDLTRWRADTTLDDWGTYCWIREGRSGAVWSPTRRPFGTAQTTATFSPDRAEFRKRGQDLEAALEVTVATGEDVEIRRLVVANRSLRSQSVEISFYTELALSPHAADRAHPAFEKMFVQTEKLDESALLAWRRQRAPHDNPIFVGCVLLGADSMQFETNRAQFLGRSKSLDTANSLSSVLSGTTGAVIDPVFALRTQMEIGPRETRVVTLCIMAAESREQVVAMISRLRRPEAISTAFELAWTRAQLELRYLGMRPGMAHRFQELASHILYPFPRLRATNRMPLNVLSQAGLWTHGISGDLPILCLTVGDINGLAVLREVLLAWQFWRIRGLEVDLIILNREPPSYDLPLRHAVATIIEAQHGDRNAGMGKVFLIDWHSLTEAQQTLLLSVARVVLGTHLGPLQRQLQGSPERKAAPKLLPAPRPAEPSPPLPFLELPYFNGIGGFTAGGNEYAIYMPGVVRPPAPWANVIANPRFGTVLTESGLGFTWFGNSQQNRLTPWHNDPVRDPQSEAIYIRDEDTGALWTPTALPIRETEPYRARHGQGYTAYEHNSQAIGQELTVFVAENDPVKLCRLVLRNHSSRARKLSVTYYVEWVLGSVREVSAPHVRTSYDIDAGAITASQCWTGPYTGQIAFAASSPKAASYTCDRTSFLGRDGSLARPSALTQSSLGNRCGDGCDPCGALQVAVPLAPGEQREITFALGSADSLEMMRTLAEKYREPQMVHAAMERVRGSWEARLNTIQVKTPVLSVDFLLNRWLPYQTLSCRFWARSATYQSGGAVGFRDQLQDSLALIYSQPGLTRSHILTAASRQFPEGDVQHWWHAETGLGVRTNCSDDYLWLPWVAARYVAITGDTGILDEPVAFLEGPAIPDGEQEYMFQPTLSSRRETLWEHCRRAIELASTRLGPHQLPLFGSCDWNDGMSRVGVEGRGESVWLAWFLNTVLIDAAEVEDRFDAARAETWRRRASALETAIETHAWDGDWYLRGFFDDGSRLGSHHNEEARIDSLSQSWAVLSGAANSERAARAMASAEENLVRPQDGLVLLFTPPFDHSKPHPGYIMGYPPGMRENGGQYTHGSLWMAQARARMFDGEGAVALLQLMNPVERTRTPQGVAAYRGEPYVVAADVSAAKGRVGASGWTWYTGSSGWMYRIWVEDVLGFHVRGNVLRIIPVIPDEWPGFELTYRFRTSTYRVEVTRGENAGALLDGHRLPQATFPLVDDGREHRIQVMLPPKTADVQRQSGTTTQAVTR